VVLALVAACSSTFTPPDGPTDGAITDRPPADVGTDAPANLRDAAADRPDDAATGRDAGDGGAGPDSGDGRDGSEGADAFPLGPCARAVPVDLAGGPVMLTGQSTDGLPDSFPRESEGDCATLDGPDAIYAVTVPAGRALVAAGTPTDASFDLSLSLVDGPACDVAPVLCLMRNGVATADGTVTLRYSNRAAVDRTLYLVVDAPMPRPFDLSLSLEDPPPAPPNDACAGAQQVDVSGPPAELTDQTNRDATDDYPAGVAGCQTLDHPDVVYAVSIPPHQRLSVFAQPNGRSDITLSLVDGSSPDRCQRGQLTCLTAVDAGGFGDPEQLTLLNAGSVPRPVFIIVDAFEDAAVFSLDLSATPVPDGDLCELPIPVDLASGTATLDGQSLDGFASDYGESSGNGCQLQGYADVVYLATVPPAANLTVTVTPDPTFDPSLSLIVGSPDQCNLLPPTCAASANARLAGGIETVSYRNAGTAPAQVYTIVDSATPTGTFSISFTLQ
jgi:hypothetical protein